MRTTKKLIVGLGGTLRPASSTERAVSGVLAQARLLGADTLLFSGEGLNLPMYAPHCAERDSRVSGFLAAVREADALVIGSPGYHGGISGLVKNALDYIEDTAQDPQPYLEGRAVGVVATGAGWQGCNAAMQALRSVVHALRGWPSPLGITLNTRQPLFAEDGGCLLPEVTAAHMKIMAAQLMGFACGMPRPHPQESM